MGSLGRYGGPEPYNKLQRRMATTMSQPCTDIIHRSSTDIIHGHHPRALTTSIMAPWALCPPSGGPGAPWPLGPFPWVLLDSLATLTLGPLGTWVRSQYVASRGHVFGYRHFTTSAHHISPQIAYLHGGVFSFSLFSSSLLKPF